MISKSVPFPRSGAMTCSCHKHPISLPYLSNPCRRFGVFGGIMASLTHQVLLVYRAFVHAVLRVGLINPHYEASSEAIE